MISFTPSEIAAYYQTRVPSLKQTRGAREWRGPCPIHQGKDDNFSVNPQTGQAHCHSQCGQGWDVLSLEEALTGDAFAAARTEVFRIMGKPDQPFGEENIEATYDYTDEAGRVLYQVVRFRGKQFKQRRPAPNGEWIWGIKGITPVPYKLPKLAGSPFVAIVEGEKDVLTLEGLGIPATCNNGGACHFRQELAPHFTGKSIGIFPDFDEKGRQHALEVAHLLAPVAKSIRIVELPGLRLKGDVTDFVATGGTKDQIRDYYSRTPEWTPDFEFALSLPDESDEYVRSFAQVLSDAGGLDRFWNLLEQEGLPTPWPALTRAMGGGMRKGEVYVIGANQGSGKTSLALQFTTHVTRKGHGAVMFSMEMGWRDVFQRICSIEARVDLLEYRELQRHKANTAEIRQRLQRVTSELIGLPLLVSRKPSVTPEYLVSESHRLQKRHKIELIVIDHMQLMSTTGKRTSDYEKFTAISRATKQVAVELDVPVLLVSQTSRSNSKDKRLELEVSDLRGSGAIEEDAASVLLLYPDKDDKDRTLADGTFAKGPVKSWLKAGKNRFGLQDMYFPLIHWKGFTRFDLHDGGAA